LLFELTCIGSGCGEKNSRLAGEATKDGFARRGFKEMKDREGKQDEDGIRQPGIEGGEVKTFGDPVSV
jgi:hypothetical protein